MIAYFCLYLENFYSFRVGWFVPFGFSVDMGGLCRAGVSRFEKQILPREVVDLGVAPAFGHRWFVPDTSNIFDSANS